jgi:hypothetical protein
MINIPAHLEVKLEIVSLVDRIVGSVFRDLDIPVAKAELTDGRVKGKPVDSMTCSINQDGRGTIKHITGSH